MKEEIFQLNTQIEQQKTFNHQACEQNKGYAQILQKIEELESENILMRKYFKSKKMIRGLVQRMSGRMLSQGDASSLYEGKHFNSVAENVPTSNNAMDLLLLECLSKDQQ